MNIRSTLAAALAAAALAGLAGCETTSVGGTVSIHDRDMDLRVVFTDYDRRILRDYYRVDYRTLPPGLAKKGKIPPGHAYRVRVRQPLPPEVDWRYLPYNLERQLSRLPDGYVRVIIGTNVAIMNVRTRVIVDLIEDIDD
ncbi:MAG: hypothetical protein ACK4UX_03630 [Thiobacillus sp.]